MDLHYKEDLLYKESSNDVVVINGFFFALSSTVDNSAGLFWNSRLYLR